MRYHEVPANPAKEGLGHHGGIIYDLIIEHKPHLYRQLKKQGKLTEFILDLDGQYREEMLLLLDSGLNESQAREIAWPEITAQFGM